MLQTEGMARNRQASIRCLSSQGCQSGNFKSSVKSLSVFTVWLDFSSKCEFGNASGSAAQSKAMRPNPSFKNAALANARSLRVSGFYVAQ